MKFLTISRQIVCMLSIVRDYLNSELKQNTDDHRQSNFVIIPCERYDTQLIVHKIIEINHEIYSAWSQKTLNFVWTFSEWDNFINEFFEQIYLTETVTVNFYETKDVLCRQL